MSDEGQIPAVGWFNYAHSYAASTIELENTKVDATHLDAVVYYLYFHAIELYIKSFLIAHDDTADGVREKYGHNVRKLVDASKELGLSLEEMDEQVINLMKDTDNVISSRYIRTGGHTRLPFTVYQEIGHRLHEQIGPKAYDGTRVERRPILRISDVDTLIRPHTDH